MAKNIFSNERGYGIVETIVYTALVGVISLVIVNVAMVISRANSRIVSIIELNSGASAAMERMIYEIKNSERIYTPASKLSTTVDPQLSLATAISPQSGESLTYVDFYLANNAIFLKQEGVNPIALTSPDISVENLRFDRYVNGTRESVKIDFTAHPANSLSSSATVHLVTTVALR